MIEFQNVTFTYHSTERESGVYNLNLTIPDGQVVLLCGESGCGKTTLTRLINGLTPEYYEGKLDGVVLVNGKDTVKTPLYELSKAVGSVFQNPRSQFFNVDTTGEIAFGCENYGFPHDDIVTQVERTATELQINNLLEEKVRYLSYGMRQRVAIASAKAIDPPIYVMDEPSANLDMKATVGLADLIQKLKVQGKTILIAEHRLYYLQNIADRIVYLQDGKIVAEFSPSDMAKLPTEQIREWGLRSMELRTLPVQERDAPPSVDAIFEVKGLCKNFGSHIVAENVGFQCKKGEIIAVVGPNAAGKSTLVKILSGLVKENSGTISYMGKRLKPSGRRGLIWYIMQDLDSQLFGEDLMDELLTGQKVTPERKQRAEEILRELDLSSLVEHHPATLSGGQKQRLALGVALMNEAPVLILDEPTSGLDGKNMRKVSEQIKKLAARGHIILMITHDIECALSTCNRALHIKNGCLIDDFEIKNAEQLLRAMQ